jgi:cobalt-zinc-cadmium efflux system outer membrane protein
MRRSTVLPVLALATALGPWAWSAPPDPPPAAADQIVAPAPAPPAALISARFFGDEAGAPLPAGAGAPVSGTILSRLFPEQGTASSPPPDATVRRAQVASPDVPAIPGAGFPVETPAFTAGSGTPISLEAALYGAITSNPDLVALRNSNIASPESVEVARRFPTTLNPTLWTDIRPWVWGPNPNGRGARSEQVFVYLSWRQPVELGHQTTHRYEIAKAAYNQQQWTVVQAEMLALVQTYRFFQTAAYRREKLRVARGLADFNDRLLQSLKKGFEANRVAAADVALAEVENQATRQQVSVAEQDYAIALTDLRNQIGIPETAGTAEPLGEFVLPTTIPPLQDEGLIQLALQSRPEIHVAEAQVAGTCAAVNLARGDRIPTPIVGPEYEKDNTGASFYGFVVIMPLPVVNNGTPLVRQREADHRRAVVALQQVQQRTVAQVKAAVGKWNAANRLVSQTTGLTEGLKTQVARMERLFEANQANLPQLLQARQRLMQLENSELDALWQATQAQADLLTALGAPTLIASLQQPNQGTSPAPPPVAQPR